MNLVANGTAVILLIACALTALIDFFKKETAFELTRRLKIPDRALPVLGAIKALAAVGLAIGFTSVGMAKLVGVCLCIYFAVATATHTRVKETLVQTAPAFVLTVLSVLYTLATFAQ